MVLLEEKFRDHQMITIHPEGNRNLMAIHPIVFETFHQKTSKWLQKNIFTCCWGQDEVFKENINSPGHGLAQHHTPSYFHTVSCMSLSKFDSVAQHDIQPEEEQCINRNNHTLYTPWDWKCDQVVWKTPDSIMYCLTPTSPFFCCLFWRERHLIQTRPNNMVIGLRLD